MLITMRHDSRFQKFLQDRKTHGHGALSPKHLNLLQRRRKLLDSRGENVDPTVIPLVITQ
jgi:hypothetical protein